VSLRAARHRAPVCRRDREPGDRVITPAD
jgi:hypothetical protein